MSHNPERPDDDLPPDAEIPKERWPGQFDRYREDPTFGDYEAMLGDSPLNVDNLDDFLRVTEHPTPPPWEREGPCGKDAGLHQSGKWKGRDPAEVAAEMAKYGGTAPDEKRCAGASTPPRTKGSDSSSPPLTKGGPGGVDKNVARTDAPGDPPNPPFARGGEDKPRRKPRGTKGSPGPCGPDGAAAGPATRAGATKKRCADASRARKPRCTKHEKDQRIERVSDWLHSGCTAAQIYLLCKQVYRLSKRSAQLYLQDVKQKLADEASKEDYLAHLQLSKNQHDALYQRAAVNLDKIDDPTKIASLLRAANTVLKDRDKVMEDIRHHRAVTRRDQSPDSRKNRLKREDIVEMPFAELCERIENLRNLNWWDWNQARMFGGETHFNDILSRKIDPELGYYDAIRAKNWQWYAKKRAEREAAEAAEREKGGGDDKVTR